MTIVKRFVYEFPGGERHYSIRRREDGTFQVWDEVAYGGISEPSMEDICDEPISGLYGDAETAEAELLRTRPYLEVAT